MKIMFSENEAIDKLFRDRAYEIYDNIHQWLKSNIEVLQQRDAEYGSPWYDDEFKRVGGGGYVLRYEDMFDVSIDIDIIFVPDMKIQGEYNTKGGFGSYKESDGKVIVLPVLLAPWDLKYIDTRFSSMKTTIIHEIIYFFDDDRSGGKSQGGSIEIITDYYNSPAEFNAYYQEGVFRISDWLSNDKIRDKLFNNMEISFDEFHKLIISKHLFDTEFIENLNDRNRKSLLKRLYDFYVTKKEEYGS